MFDQIRKLFSGGSDEAMMALIKDGAQVIDVRTRWEFSSGHVKGSINIPLQELGGNLNRIKKDKAVIVCCASGARSASAKSFLQSKGYNAHNGGSWTSLARESDND